LAQPSVRKDRPSRKKSRWRFKKIFLDGGPRQPLSLILLDWLAKEE
jgi:hypothetical protein